MEHQIRSIFAYQALGSALAAALIVWSTYHDSHSVYVNNKWLPVLKKLPDKINLLIRVFIVFERVVRGAFLRQLYSYLLSILGIQGTQVGIGVLVVVIGFAAYLFKVINDTGGYNGGPERQGG